MRVPAQEVSQLVVSIHLLELLQHGLWRAAERTVGVHGGDGGQQQGGLLGDQLLAGGRRRLRLELQDLLLLQLADLEEESDFTDVTLACEDHTCVSVARTSSSFSGLAATVGGGKTNWLVMHISIMARRVG